jgi:hypothetical protein
MNSNLFHNIANVLMILIAGVTAAAAAAGCTTLPTGTLECSQVTWLSPTVSGLLISGIGIIKMAVNIIRDGFGGLTKQQPPVQ